MRRLRVICIRVAYGLVIGWMVWMVYSIYFTRAKGRSGPTPEGIIWSRLDRIEYGKRQLKERGLSDDYWPTREEIADASTGLTNTLSRYPDLFEPTAWREVYIINRLGAPSYAYLSNAIGRFPEGFLITLEDLESDFSGELEKRLNAARAIPTTNAPATTNSPP